MIEKILSELQELPHGEYTDDYGKGFSAGINAAMKIVQEVAKEYDWIPVEQKLPEDFTNVYATCISLLDDREPWVIEGVYHSLTGWEEMTPFLSWGYAKIIAWMPKKRPAPYQKGE